MIDTTPAYTATLTQAAATSATFKGDVIWESGATRMGGGARAAGEATFNARVFRLDGTDKDAAWLGTIQIYSTDEDGNRVAEDLLGADSSDSVGPLGTYPLRLVRGLNYEFEALFAAGDPSTIEITLQVWP